MKKYLWGCLLLPGVILMSNGGWIYLKAEIAQQLLEQSWQKMKGTAHPAKPWPWADTWAVAKLTVPGHDIEYIVLAGDSGRTLAFGPGYTMASAMPGEPGSVVISGHRDTHFRFLKDLQRNDTIDLQTANGYYHYKVREVRVLDAGKDRLVSSVDGSLLHLVTCYPFDSVVSGGPLRYVVDAELIEL